MCSGGLRNNKEIQVFGGKGERDGLRETMEGQVIETSRPLKGL